MLRRTCTEPTNKPALAKRCDVVKSQQEVAATASKQDEQQQPLLRYEGDAAAGAAGAGLPAHVLLIDEEVLALRCVSSWPFLLSAALRQYIIYI